MNYIGFRLVFLDFVTSIFGFTVFKSIVEFLLLPSVISKVFIDFFMMIDIHNDL